MSIKNENMPTEDYKIKIKQFVDHLLTIPNIVGEPILIGESLIHNFIINNIKTLKVTFQSPRFFPDLQWDEVINIIAQDLYSRVDSEVMPLIDSFIITADFSPLNAVNEGQAIPNDYYKEKLREFIALIFQEKSVRYNFNSVVNIFKYDVIEKYVTEIFNRRDALYNELIRVQKTYLDCDDYIIFLKVLLLVKNAVYYKVALGGNNSQKLNLEDQLKTPGKLKGYLQKLTRYWQQKVPMLSYRSVDLAFKANLKSTFSEMEDASSKFLYILTSRFHNYKQVTVDRGAESPDKSWFNVARANYAMFGFDKRVIDDLYMIAADNFW